MIRRLTPLCLLLFAVNARAQTVSSARAAPAGAVLAQAAAPVALAAPIAVSGPRMLITGPPGSGKGTYSEKIGRDYGVVHVSVGALLRSYAKSHPEIAETMAAGRLVDSDVVLKVVREHLEQDQIRKHGFILDGFPRRLEEAAALTGMLGTTAVDAVIELNVAEDELLRRILSRGRTDDREDVFHERMRIYREQTKPAVEIFKSASPVLAPEVAGPDAEINYSRLKAALNALFRLKDRSLKPRRATLTNRR